MSQAELTGRIEEHKSILQKYYTVSGILGYARLFLFLLTGICVVVLSYCIFKDVRKTEMIAIILLELAALAAVLLYHRRVREIIRRSDKMIIVNKKHLDEMENMLAAYPENDTEFFYRDYLYRDYANESFAAAVVAPIIHSTSVSVPGTVAPAAAAPAAVTPPARAQANAAFSPSPQWEQYLADYKQAQADASADDPEEDVPLLSKVSAMKFLLM